MTKAELKLELQKRMSADIYDELENRLKKAFFYKYDVVIDEICSSIEKDVHTSLVEFMSRDDVNAFMQSMIEKLLSRKFIKPTIEISKDYLDKYTLGKISTSNSITTLSKYCNLFVNNRFDPQYTETIILMLRNSLYSLAMQDIGDKEKLLSSTIQVMEHIKELGFAVSDFSTQVKIYSIYKNGKINFALIAKDAKAEFVSKEEFDIVRDLMIGDYNYAITNKEFEVIYKRLLASKYCTKDDKSQIRNIAGRELQHRIHTGRPRNVFQQKQEVSIFL